MLILASQSPSRAHLLNQAGVPFQIYPSCVDESVIKKMCGHQNKTAEETSLALALEKARSVAEVFPDQYVLGADQMVECDGQWLDKAESLSEAREQLKFLRGKTHSLPTSAVVLHGKNVVWQVTITPHLTMRSLSDGFIDLYLETIGPAAFGAVGCYQIEKLGLQLFDHIEGDIFTIMGLPMLPLLSFLRDVNLVHR